MQRRTFLLACAAAPFAGACARMAYVSGRLDAGRIIVERRDVAGRDGALVEHPSLAFPLYVREAGAGVYTAVLTRCMHRGCAVEPVDGRLVCPCHGSEYTTTGEILKGPTELPLIRCLVQVDDDRLYISAPNRSAA
jgi:cytochrome b6-f complex iron-sulfur subunit